MKFEARNEQNGLSGYSRFREHSPGAPYAHLWVILSRELAPAPENPHSHPGSRVAKDCLKKRSSAESELQETLFMISATAVWIDRNVAKILRLPNGPMQGWSGGPGDCLVFHAHRRDHHTHAFDHLDQEKVGRRLYDEVVQNLSPDNDLIILGPGMARFHFYNYLKEHHPLVGKRVVACEAIDHVTDGQVAARARRLIEERSVQSTGS